MGLIAFQYAQPAKVIVNYPSASGSPGPLATAYLVAAHPLQAGTLVRDEDFTAKPIETGKLPESVAADGAIVDGAEERSSIRGALVLHYIEAGAPVSRADLLRPRDRGFLAAVLAPGTRAVSVGVDPVTGVAGLIWPGDRVDVILTQQIEAQTASLARRVFGETVLTDIRVIGVDQDIAQGASATAGVAGKLARTVTLQVAPEQAERLAVAQRLGHVALAIRAIGEASPQAVIGRSTVFGEDVSPALSRAGDPIGARIQVIEGDKRSEVVFK
jgi:pilus assembly protein CpaB